jgi:hypothetical protein
MTVNITSAAFALLNAATTVRALSVHLVAVRIQSVQVR